MSLAQIAYSRSQSAKQDVRKKLSTSILNVTDGQVSLAKGFRDLYRSASSSRMEYTAATPSWVGPGEYKLRRDTGKIQPTIQQRYTYSTEHMPSPTRYNLQPAHQPTGFTIKSKPKEPKPRQSPAPDQYAPKLTDLQTKKHSLSLAIPNETITISPGPGSYDQTLKTNQGFTIAKTDRSYYDIFRPKQLTPDFAPQKQFEIKPVKIATYRFKAERNDNPGPYDTRSAYEYLHPKKQLSIQEAGFRTVTGAAEGIQKQLSAQQVKLQKQLVEQLKAELEIGRKTLGIGMEGKKMSREERKQLNEASACFKTFNTANEYEIHFAMAGPGYEGLVHGRIITMKLFPHNFPKVIIDHEHFKQPVISNELLKTWHPQMGTYVLLQQVADQFRVLNAVNADLVIVDASISKQFACKTCGCRNEEWVAKLLKNRQK
ncbi:Hypothetical_protein [Hexamita inflata]|uniref:Hypothetical_protein n=1 Tax=Hexamita inflata TaxID=28002 RepID=A0AA86QLP4_9EUKA|nr:Hypothetical protein HINF_LOCUS43104 [Hexamita inflata]